MSIPPVSRSNKPENPEARGFNEVKNDVTNVGQKPLNHIAQFQKLDYRKTIQGHNFIRGKKDISDNVFKQTIKVL